MTGDRMGQLLDFTRARAPLPVEPAQADAEGSLPPALPSPPAVTHGDDAARFTAVPRAAGKRVASAAGWLGSGAHMTARSPSLTEGHQKVHEAAGRIDVPVLAWARLAYGYCWLTLKALFDFLEAVTFSPLAFLALAGVICLFIFVR